MNTYVLGFQETDITKLPMVGGKGANLGELSRIEGIRVPEGFCVTTDAYKKTTAQIPEFPELLERLSHINAAEGREGIGEISGKIRRAIEETPIPAQITEAVTRYLTKLGEKDAYAVRSSATSEDLPTASFAGQQDMRMGTLRRPKRSLPSFSSSTKKRQPRPKRPSPKLFPVLQEKGMAKEIDYIYGICQSRWGIRGGVNVYNNAVAAEDITFHGLSIMARNMGIGVL